MKRLFTLISFALFCAMSLFAQTENTEEEKKPETFVDHITNTENGPGVVTINQDARLTDILNGDKQLRVATTRERVERIPGVQTGKKIKARGYRIQVFWGGSNRSDQSNAQRAGSKVTSIYPELHAYTSFEAPHWRCRVGDFATRDEAEAYYNKIRSARIVSDIMIVKSEVYVYNPQYK